MEDLEEVGKIHEGSSTEAVAKIECSLAIFLRFEKEGHKFLIFMDGDAFGDELKLVSHVGRDLRKDGSEVFRQLGRDFRD